MKNQPRLFGSAPMVWKIRLICELCKVKAVWTPKNPKLIIQMVDLESAGKPAAVDFSLITKQLLYTTIPNYHAFLKTFHIKLQ